MASDDLVFGDEPDLPEAPPNLVKRIFEGLSREEKIHFVRAMIRVAESAHGSPPDPETLATIEDFKLRYGEDGPMSGPNWRVEGDG